MRTIESKFMEYGLIDTADLGLPFAELLVSIQNCLSSYSYNYTTPPDFRGFFVFIATNFAECRDLDLLQKVTDILASIAGYKLGVLVADIFTRVTGIIIQLLSSNSVTHLKSAVDYFRKVARAVGPRVVLEKFVIPNVENAAIQRGLVIIAHQMILDNPEFPFTADDFGDWITNLIAVVGVGQRFAALIKERVPDAHLNDDLPTVRPPTVPAKFSLGSVLKQEPVPRKPPAPPPKSARPQIPRRMFGTNSRTRDTSTPVMFQMTNRQQQVREFVDEPFDEDQRVIQIVDQMRRGIADKDWEERSAAYNTAKRLIRYTSESVSDDDLHSLVTAILDDISTPRAALALSSIGALSESFVKKGGSMELELARIIPVMMKLHQKTAKFFEAALAQCFDDIIQNIPSKRFISVLVSSGETRSSKVHTAVARYIRESLQKSITNSEKLFTKNSNEIAELIKLLNRLISGAAAETRDAAKESARLLAQIYGDSFNGIVSRTLESRDSGDFLRVI